MLGYGTNAYFEVLLNLSQLFILIAAFSVPVFYIYGTGVRYSTYELWPIIRFIMGNFGGSTVFCKTTRMGYGEIHAQCPPGTYFDATKAVWGVMSN